MISRILAGRTILLGSALLTMAASPPRYSPLAFADPVLSAVAPAPQPAASSGFTPAPVPNVDLQFNGNSNRDVDPTAVSVKPSLLSQPRGYMGEGYTPFSTVPDEQQQTKRFVPRAGVNFSVPLQ